MTETLTPTPPAIPHDSMLYDRLRELGIEHIEDLAGAIWNEYNASDPGITILEVLSYAIADLSYRTSFEVKDLLTSYTGDRATPQDFYLPQEILPNHPWTARDLRKILLDKPKYNPHPDSGKLELRNVWPVVSKKSEQQLWFHTDDLELQYEEELFASLPTGEDHPEKSGHDKIILNGLYELQLEFEPDPEEKEEHLKDLNLNFFKQTFYYKRRGYEMTLLMPYWDDISWDLKDINLPQASLDPRGPRSHFISVDKYRFDEYFYDYFAELNLKDVAGNLYPIDLNIRLDDPLRTTINIPGVGNGLEIEVQFVDWHEVANRVDWDYSQIIAVDTPAQIGANGINPVDVSGNADEMVFDLALAFKLPPTPSGDEETMMARITFLEPQYFGAIRQQIPVVKSSIRDGFRTSNGQPAYILQERMGYEAAMEAAVLDLQSGYWSHYLEKLNLVFNRVYGSLGAGHENLFNYLGSRRNVCEDFYRFTTSRVQEIALFGNLVIAPGYNPNKILGEVYYLIDQFLSPIVRFHTLTELQAKGQKFAEIFNGPLLQHGFLPNEELEILNRREAIYVSDLINFIMEIEGVIAIEGLTLSNYIDNRLMGSNVQNCLSLTRSELYRPKLSIPKSVLTATVDEEPYPLQQDKILHWYDGWVRNRLANQLPLSRDDMPTMTQAETPILPKGDDMEVENYFSIQHDFPEIYGIGPYGLPLDATPARQSQAKQLKGYLLFFDQLLANYLSQVSNLRELFSASRQVDRTYFHQPLYEVPDAAPLFQAFVNSGQTWEDFKADLGNAYTFRLNEATEGAPSFLDRRNRFLDHLIGRFSESFTDYAVAMYHRERGELDNLTSGDPTEIANVLAAYEQKRAAVARRLIEDKGDFLREYPALSNERARAYNYLQGPFWGQGPAVVNVSGYKKRLCRMLGIRDYSHHSFFAQGTEGMHVVEHILLRPFSENDALLTVKSPSLEYFQSERDPYSFRISLVLSDEIGRFGEAPFRKFAERLIRMETPAHIALDIIWMNRECGIEFERLFRKWLELHARLIPMNRSTRNYGQPVPIKPINPVKPVKHILNLPEQQEAEEAPTKFIRPLPVVEEAEKIDQEQSKHIPVDEQEEMQSIAPSEQPLRAIEPIDESIRDRKLYVEAPLTEPIRDLKAPVDPIDPIKVDGPRAVRPQPSFYLNDRAYRKYNEVKTALIHSLNEPCGSEVAIDLIAYDQNGIAFVPDANRHISYRYGDTDVYAFRFLPPGGIAKFYKLDSNGSAQFLFDLPNAPQQHLVPNGFAEDYGHEGHYRVDYEYQGQTIQLFIDVEKGVVPPTISLFNVEDIPIQQLPENDCYYVQPNWTKTTYMEFRPTGGTAYIYSTDGPQDVLLHTVSTSEFFLTPLGIGTYRVEYHYQGRIETICLIIQWVHIRAYDELGNAGEYTPDANRKVTISGQAEAKVRVEFTPPGGEATRYIVPATGNPTQDLVIQNAQSDTLHFTETGTYSYVYRKFGLSETLTIEFLKGDVPTIEIRNEGNFVEPNEDGLVVIDQWAFTFQQTEEWTVHFGPEGGDWELHYNCRGDLEEILLGSVTDPANSTQIRVTDLWRILGPGTYYYTYTVNGQSVTQGFVITPPIIRVFTNTGQELARDANDEIHFDIQDQQQYHIVVGPKDGHLNITRIAGGTNATIGNDLSAEVFVFIPQAWGGGTYRVGYLKDDCGHSEVMRIVIAEQAPNNVAKAPENLEVVDVDQVEDRVYKVKFVSPEEAEVYRWEMNGRYRARSASPRITIDFNESDPVKLLLKTTTNEVTAEQEWEVSEAWVKGLM